MEQTEPTSPASPSTEEQRPGRMLATIVRVSTREKGFVFAQLVDATRAEEPEECFIHKTTVPPEIWDTLECGSAITCKVQETSKGLRGWDIAPGTEEDQDRVNAEEEFRGNRG